MYVLLFLFWVILNTKATLEIVLLGLVLAALDAVLMKILFDYTLKRDLRLCLKVPLFICYIFVLLAEILKAALSVMHYIFSADAKRKPALVTFDPHLRTELGRFILANSITLTPGTITVQVKDGVFTVHCLSRDLLDTAQDSVFLKWIRRLEA